MAIDRGCYIDQSQSLNIHMEQPNSGKLTSLHFHAWSKVTLNPTLFGLHLFLFWDRSDFFSLFEFEWPRKTLIIISSVVGYQGLKTGMYYLRTRAAADAIKFTVDTTLLKVITFGDCALAFVWWIIYFWLIVNLSLARSLSWKMHL